MKHFEKAVAMLLEKKYNEAEEYVKKHNLEIKMGSFLVTNPTLYNTITAVRPLFRSLWVDQTPQSMELGLAAKNIEYVQYCIHQRVDTGTDWFPTNASKLAATARIMGRISIAEEIEKAVGLSF